MPTENMVDALGLDALTGFSEQTWAEFLLGLAQHSGEINRFFGRHEEAHWNTLTIGQVKEWYEWRRRQQYGLEAPLAQTLAYGGYKMVNPPGEGEAMAEMEKPWTEGDEREKAQAQAQLEFWKTHPEDENNPEYWLTKTLKGRAPDDPTLTEREKQIITVCQWQLESTKGIASGRVRVRRRFLVASEK
jgi:hypothetical protein